MPALSDLSPTFGTVCGPLQPLPLGPGGEAGGGAEQAGAEHHAAKEAVHEEHRVRLDELTD